MKKHLILLLCCIGLCSCTSVSYMSIDTLNPSEISFPLEIRSVGVVDNVVNHDTLLSRAITVGTIEGDGRIMAKQLADFIVDSDYFDEVILCDSSLRMGDKVDNATKLPQETVSELSADLGVDMLVVVDSIYIRTWPDMRSYWDLPHPIEVVAGEISSAMSLYMSYRKEPIHLAFSAQDTLCWDLDDFTLSERKMVREASTHAAALSAKYIIPQWKTETRFYYSGGSVDLRDAACFVRENKWDEAFTLWKKVYDSSKSTSKKRMWSAFNIALYYEMQSNIPKAQNYAKEAMGLAKQQSDKSMIAYYWSKLSGKELDIKKLDLQMQRFKENNSD